jgi:hypothetical protein
LRSFAIDQRWNSDRLSAGSPLGGGDLRHRLLELDDLIGPHFLQAGILPQIDGELNDGSNVVRSAAVTILAFP